LGPWAEAHGCGAMQTGGLKPLFAGKWKRFAPRKKQLLFKAVEDFNPLRTIDVEWDCCMAAGFNLQPRLAGGEAAAGLGA